MQRLRQDAPAFAEARRAGRRSPERGPARLSAGSASMRGQVLARSGPSPESVTASRPSMMSVEKERACAASRTEHLPGIAVEHGLGRVASADSVAFNPVLRCPGLVMHHLCVGANGAPQRMRQVFPLAEILEPDSDAPTPVGQSDFEDARVLGYHRPAARHRRDGERGA